MNIKAKLLVFGALAVLSLAAVKGAQAATYLNVVTPNNQPEGTALTSPADHITFFYFNLTNEASSTEDINLSRLVINNVGTSGEQARSAFSVLYLCADPNVYFNGNCGNNLVAQTSIRSGRNGYLFTNFNYTIPQGQTRYFTLIATVNVAVREGLTIKPAINNANSLRAMGAETRTRTQVSGNFPIQGNEFTIDNQNGINGLGGLLAADDGTNPISANVVAGSAMVPVLNVRFMATDHSFRLNSLRFTQMIEGTTRSVESLTISYQNQAGNRVTVTRNFSNNSNIVTFSLYNDPAYVAANDAGVVLNVYANLATINQNFGAYTGDQLKFAMLANQGFLARNDNNRLVRDVYARHGDRVEGNIMVVHGTVPIVEAEGQNGDLNNGAVDLYRFKVTAAEGTDLSLKKLSFKLSMTDSVINSATLYLQNFQILEGPSYNAAQALTQNDSGADSYQVYAAFSNASNSTTTVQTGNLLTATRLSHATAYLYQNNAVFDERQGQGATNTHDIIAVFNDDRLIPSGQSKYFILKAIAGNVDTGANSNDSIGVYMYDGDTEISNRKYLSNSCDLYRTNCRMSKYGLSSDGNDNNGANGWNNVMNQEGAYMIWSDSSGVNGNHTHQDTNGDRTYDGQDVTPSADWFNGWNVRTLSEQRMLQ